MSRKKLPDVTTSACDEGWIITFTGTKFYPLEPRPEDVHIEDIAHALSNLCRFTGHCKKFYSVAEHSIHVSRLVEWGARDLPPQEVALVSLAGLLHDASEAYLCDLARPLKRQPAMGPYRTAEVLLQNAIDCRYDVDGLGLNAVYEADERIVTNEAYQLLPCIPEGWQLRTGYTQDELFTALQTEKLPCYGPGEAKRHFIARFAQLQADMAQCCPKGKS